MLLVFWEYMLHLENMHNNQCLFSKETVLIYSRMFITYNLSIMCPQCEDSARTKKKT